MVTVNFRGWPMRSPSFLVRAGSVLMACVVFSIGMMAGSGQVLAQGTVDAPNPTGAPTRAFSGTMVLSSGDRPPLRMGIAHTVDKTAIIMKITGRTIRQIVDRKAQRVWVILPHKKVYLVRPLTSRRDVVAMMVPKGATAKRVGAERLAGIETIRYSMEGTNPRGRTFKGTMWRSVAGNIVVKLQGMVSQKDGTSVPFQMVMKNLSLTPPPAAVFAIPPGFKKIAR